MFENDQPAVSPTGQDLACAHITLLVRPTGSLSSRRGYSEDREQALVPSFENEMREEWEKVECHLGNAVVQEERQSALRWTVFTRVPFRQLLQF